MDHYKDLGVMFDCYLNFHQHTSEVVSKANATEPPGYRPANCVLACMKRAFTDLNRISKAVQSNDETNNRICEYNLGSTLFVG